MSAALLYGLVILSAIAHAVWNALGEVGRRSHAHHGGDPHDRHDARPRSLAVRRLARAGELEMARRHRRRDVRLLRAPDPLLRRRRHERRLSAGAWPGAGAHHDRGLPRDRRGLEHGPGRSRGDDLARHHGLVVRRRRQPCGRRASPWRPASPLRPTASSPVWACAPPGPCWVSRPAWRSSPGSACSATASSCGAPTSWSTRAATARIGFLAGAVSVAGLPGLPGRGRKPAAWAGDARCARPA